LHDISGLVNAHQSSAERKMKYTFARWAGLSKKEADRYRDWNWSKLTGVFCYGHNPDDCEAIRILNEIGYEVFKDEHKVGIKPND
jgi:hypothetical protein